MGKKTLSFAIVFLISLAIALSFVSATGAWTQDLNSGLISSWKLDDNLTSTNVIDSSSINNGTLLNALNTTNIAVLGRINTALLFDGDDDSINTTLTANNNFTANTGFSISAWIYPLTVGEGGVGRIVDKGAGTSTQNGFTLQLFRPSGAGSENLRFRINGGTSPSGANGIIDLNVWNFVVATINDTQPNATVSFYVNGILTGSPNQDLNKNLLNITTLNPLTIGQRSLATDGTFNGTIDDVNIWNRVLTLEEIIDLNSSITYSQVCVTPSINNNYVAQFNNKCNLNSNINLGSGDFIFSGSSGRFIINSNVTSNGESLTCSSSGCQKILNYNSKTIFT
jgi:hypothetical protein